MDKNKDIQEAIRLYKEQKIWKHMTTKELAEYLIPCIALNQYHVFRYETTGVAYAFTNWALMSDKVQEKFKDTGMIEKFDWDSGNNLWHMDTINTHKGNINKIYTWTCKNFLKSFSEDKEINWIRLNKSGSKVIRINKMKIKDGVQKFSNE